MPIPILPLLSTMNAGAELAEFPMTNSGFVPFIPIESLPHGDEEAMPTFPVVLITNAVVVAADKDVEVETANK